MSPTMTRRVALVAGFLVAMALQLHTSAAVVRVLLRPDEAIGLPFDRDNDRVIRVDGAPVTGRQLLGRALEGRRPGDVLPLVVANASGERRVEAPLPPRFTHPPGAGEWWPALIMDVFVPFFCLALGFGVALIRAHDPLAYLLLWLMIAFSRLLDSGTAPLVDLQAGPLLSFYDVFFRESWSAGMLVFGVYFPERLQLDRRHPWIKWIVLVPLAGLILAAALRSSLEAVSYASAAPIGEALASLGGFPLYLGMSAISLFFASVGMKWGQATSADSRRRLGLFMASSSLAFTPSFLLLLAGFATGKPGFADAPLWLKLTVLGCLGFFPVSLASVIVVERAMDVRVVIRQGLQYAFARNGIVVLRVVASAALLLAMANLAADPHRARLVRMLPLVAGVLFVAIVGRAADRLHTWTDRRFFREAYDAERILGELAERVRTMVEEGPLVSTVTRTISESLHVPQVSVLRGPDLPGRERLQQGDVVRDRATLAPLGADLLLPLAVKDELLGALCLGPKRSEEPYSPSDVRLLRSVAAQTSLALQMSRLTAAVAAEVAKRERQNRELEIAKEVQEQLFPQVYPAVPGVAMAGYCRPARGVGGDYYDFLALDSGRLGIAIGDISGKGISAALLMAGLQASLRSQAIADTRDLPRLMANLNRLLCDSSPANRYATFFYGEYEPASRRLRYVNAGHNAPMVFRGAGAETLLRLEEGGPVIGLLPPAAFQAGEMTLTPGDRIVGFTDGISEAMNTADEEWGEDRLAAAVRGGDGLSPREMIGRILEAADAFAAGAVQHDDMTLIVVSLS